MTQRSTIKFFTLGGFASENVAPTHLAFANVLKLSLTIDSRLPQKNIQHAARRLLLLTHRATLPTKHLTKHSTHRIKFFILVHVPHNERKPSHKAYASSQSYMQDRHVVAISGLLVNYGHRLLVGLLVRPWPYQPYRRRRPCRITFEAMEHTITHWAYVKTDNKFCTKITF